MSNFLGGDGFTFMSGGGGATTSSTTTTTTYPLTISGKVCDIPSGTSIIDQTLKYGYSGVTYNYSISDCTNKRAGVIQAVYNALTDTVEWYDNSTLDLGNTSSVSFSFTVSLNEIDLNVTVPDATWTFTYYKVIVQDCCTAPYISGAFILSQAGDYMTTEAGDFLITE